MATSFRGAVEIAMQTMFNVRVARCLLSGLLLSLLAPPRLTLAQGGFTTTGATQISIGRNNDGPSDGSFGAVSPPNGNFVVFASKADNLVANDTNSSSDVFLYTPGKPIELVSVVANSGQVPNGFSAGPAVSPVLPDGSYAVAFVSNAPDIVPGYTPPLAGNGNPNQVYIRLPKTNETLLVSVAPNTSGGPGQRGADSDCGQVSITALPNPNRYVVAFQSAAGNLEPGLPPLNARTIFMVVLTTINGKTTISSPPIGARRDNGVPYNGALEDPSVSGDGRFVAFNSSAAILGESNGLEQVYLFNRASRTLRMISRDAAGNPGDGNSRGASVSFQGEKVAFVTTASNLLPGAAQNRKAYQFDTAKKTFVHVNSSSSSELSNGDAFGISMSPNGRLVVFSDNGTNLVPDAATNNKVQTYIKDTDTGAIIRTSVTTAGIAADGDSGGTTFTSGPLFGSSPSFGGTGFNSRTLFSSFGSAAQNLTTVGISSDTRTNVFRSTITPPKPKLVKNAPIEAPPDVTIDKTLSGGRGATVSISLQEFEDITSSATSAFGSNTAAASSTKITYNLEIRKVGSRQKTFRTLTRNRVTISRLTPGKYSIRYRVTKTSGRTTIKSGYSAKQSLDVS